MMRILRIAIVLLLFSLNIEQCIAAIAGNNELAIDFTNQDDAISKATWSHPDRIKITKDGLGWEGESSSSIDSWIRTNPMPVGLSWRPLTHTNVYVTIDPAPSSYKLRNGQTQKIPYPGIVYVRYSPDRMHWSSWQALRYETDKEQFKGKSFFSGVVAVPHQARRNYQRHLEAYLQRKDVAWASDEAALAASILKKQPEFFRKNSPFIGYLQFLFEGSSRGSQRIRKFRASAGWGLSGMHMPARDPKAEKNRYGPWSFVAPEQSE